MSDDRPETRRDDGPDDRPVDALDVRLDRWLREAGFVPLPDDADEVLADPDLDDPWGDVDLGRIGLTDAQRDALADPAAPDERPRPPD